MAIAIGRAEATYGERFSGRTVMFGDTPADVSAALTHDVAAIAIATGRSTEAELAKAGASAVLKDLSDADLVRATIVRLTPL